ncbi:MAG TPA: dihydroneopterin aldolase [Firmicutes bacterium]|nr:dihydroneopterin aldolase [Bacillota bacterium]
MDKIAINNISVFGYHGVLPSEQELGQEFQVSLVLGVDLSGLENDRLESVLDYRLAVDAVREIIQGSRCFLLETLAQRIARRLLSFPELQEVTVKVGKPHPPLPGVRGGVFVEIFRRQGEGLPCPEQLT